MSFIFTSCTSLKKWNITYNEENIKDLMEIINKQPVSQYILLINTKVKNKLKIQLSEIFIYLI